MIQLEQIRKVLAQYPDVEVVSLDVFDTLLDRLIPSTRISQLAAEYLAARLPDTAEPGEILRSRLHYKQTKEVADEEWTVAEWLADWAGANDHDPAFVRRVGRDAELAAETIGLKLADETAKVVHWLQEQRFTLIAVSDMWLENEWLQTLLHSFGLRFDAVFSSGSTRKSKRRGTIFASIEKRLALPASAFLHLGDNFNNDLLKPRRAGWSTAWIPQQRHRFPPRIPLKLQRGPLKPSGTSEILRLLKLEPMDRREDIFVRIGYDYLAPLLILFSIVQWRIFREQKIDAVLYIARDAWLMLKAYDMIADLLPGSCPRHYLKVSRRAVVLSHPDDLLTNVKPIVGKVGRKTVGQWLGNFTITEPLRKEFLQRAGLNESSPFHESERNRLRRAGLDLRNAIQAERANHRELLRGLIDQTIGGNGIGGVQNLAIVDSGWAGTIQDVIRAIFPELRTVSGVYLGVSRQGRSATGTSSKYGMLRDDHCNAQHHNLLQSTAGVIRVWESLLRKDNGSIIELTRGSDGQVQPVADDVTFSDCDRQVIESIDRGVRQGIDARRKAANALARFSNCWSGDELEIAAGKIAGKVTIKPSRETAAAILRIDFEEGADQGRRSSVGLGGIRKGVAWYPGLLSLAYLGEANRVLAMMAAVPGHLTARHEP